MVQRVLSEDEEEEQQPNPRSGPLDDRSNKVSSVVENVAFGGLLRRPKRARVDQEGRAVKRESAVNEHRRGSRSERRAEDSNDDASPVRDFEEGGDAADEEPVRPKFETQPRDKDGYAPKPLSCYLMADPSQLCAWIYRSNEIDGLSYLRRRGIPAWPLSEHGTGP
jgi:hypothetical protein